MSSPFHRYFSRAGDFIKTGLNRFEGDFIILKTRILELFNQ